MTGDYLPRHWLQRDNLDQLHISMGDGKLCRMV